MKDLKRRANAYRIKTNPERVKQTLEAQIDDMRSRYEIVMEKISTMESEVKAVLNENGVSSILYVPYLNFARQLWKLSNQQEISGRSLAMAAKVLLDKWTARGLNPDILTAIRYQVFNIGEP
ncbi:MAG: hypothetical protein WHU95_00540 [candidate division WOR-3 bacterium]|jgi:hypothetical protein|nr:hypothetical protein [candidate division WOR-3 bacterium]MDH7518173.1 hypothetical protein [bacterium]